MPQDDKHHKNRYQIGSILFNPASGELVFEDENRTEKLAPQPAALLEMLITNDGEVVTHAAIRERLWPDSLVEYDQGVHFCMRKIRIALGDSAKSPQYIETIPKRGYRMIPTVQPAEPVTALETDDNSPEEPTQSEVRLIQGIRHHVPWIVAACFIVMLALMFVRMQSDADSPDISLAVMPFASQDHPGLSAEINALDAQLVHVLERDGSLAVIGPSSTSVFEPSVTMSTVSEQLGVDYIINPRFVRRDETSRVLVELIRSSDGAHVWTTWVLSPVDVDAVLSDISQNVLQVLVEKPKR